MFALVPAFGDYLGLGQVEVKGVGFRADGYACVYAVGDENVSVTGVVASSVSVECPVASWDDVAGAPARNATLSLLRTAALPSVDPAAFVLSAGGVGAFEFVMINKQPSVVGRSVVWMEDQAFDRPWGTFSRGDFNATPNDDDLAQAVTFTVVSIPPNLFIEPPVLVQCTPPLGGVCSELNLSFVPRTGMFGRAAIQVSLRDDGGVPTNRPTNKIN